MTIAEFLKHAASQLAALPTPQLDAERLLCHQLNVSNTQLFLKASEKLTETNEAALRALMRRRAAGEPVAYLTGQQGFWSLDLNVTTDTLIPRPDTECLVELALARIPDATPYRVVDLGTGSGAIALAIALERPQANIIATDSSAAALTVAKSNATRYQLNNVTFALGAWCEALPAASFDLIISNPPYIAENDKHLEQDGVSYEPPQALVSGESGLDDISLIAEQASGYLAPGGCLMIEHGYDQADAVKAIFSAEGYALITQEHDLSGHLRVTAGVK